MISSIILIALICPQTKLENTSLFSWNRHDLRILKNANSRCNVHYPKNSCVILFRKTGERSYNVICGEKRNE